MTENIGDERTRVIQVVRDMSAFVQGGPYHPSQLLFLILNQHAQEMKPNDEYQRYLRRVTNIETKKVSKETHTKRFANSG